jgi:glycosyltransferase involved in cell wall biosynthesis
MNRRKIKILFVRPSKSSFVQKDLELLRKYFDVRVVDSVFNIRRPKDTLKTILPLISGVLWADGTFAWFAGTGAFWAVWLSKIFGKKSIVVVGGYEVAKVPEIGYGEMLNPRTARSVKFVLDNADKVLAVSEFNKKEILKYTNSKNVELVYNAVDCDKFKPKGEREDLAITAGNPTKNTCKLKGIDTFVKASLAFPELKFVVIGTYDVDIRNRLKQIAPNVEFTGALSHEEVTSWLKKAKVYCQLSYRESFGMSLLEAMSCGCIPVISNRGALPEVVDNLGFIVDYGDVDGTIKAISNALNSEDMRGAVRERAKTFSIVEREREIKRIVAEVIS